MSQGFLKSATLFALSAVAASWFVGAKGMLAATATQTGTKPVIATQSHPSGGFHSAAAQSSIPEGWTCYQGRDIQTKDPALANTLAQYNLGKNTLSILTTANPRICAASSSIYAQKNGAETSAIFNTGENTVYLRNDVSDLPNIIHEIGHVGKNAVTDEIYKKLLGSENYTAFILASIADEAGSVAEECITAYQQMKDGTSSLYKELEELPPGHTHGGMVRILNEMIKENKGTGRILANKVSPIPSRLMDQIVSTYLQSPGIEFHLVYYAKQAQAFYAEQKQKGTSQPGFKVPEIDSETACRISVGHAYGKDGSFPETAAALNRLSAPFQTYTKSMLTASGPTGIAKQTALFIRSLGPVPPPQPSTPSTTRLASDVSPP